MSDRIRLFIAVYIGFLAAALTITADEEGDLKALANRTDLRVAIMEIKGQTEIIIPTRKLRNDQRRQARSLEQAARLLTIAVAVASPALIASVGGAWLLIGISMIALGGAGYFTVMAL
jgi:hypothetical protein